MAELLREFTPLMQWIQHDTRWP